MVETLSGYGIIHNRRSKKQIQGGYYMPRKNATSNAESQVEQKPKKSAPRKTTAKEKTKVVAEETKKEIEDDVVEEIEEAEDDISEEIQDETDAIDETDGTEEANETEDDSEELEEDVEEDNEELEEEEFLEEDSDLDEMMELEGEPLEESEEVNQNKGEEAAIGENQEENGSEDVAEEPKPKRTVKRIAQKKVTQNNQLELTPEELEYIYEKRRYSLATKDERRELYRQEDVVMIPGREVKTDADLKREEAYALQLASQSIPKKVLNGIIQGFGYTPNGIPVFNVTQEGTKGFIQIKIPASQMFMYDAKQYESMGDNGKKFLEHEMIARIGAPIRFCVYQFDEKNMIAYGSRIAAMESDAAFNYVHIPPNEDRPRIFEGILAQAVVIGVRRDRVRIEVFGADTTLKSEDLSWKALGVLTDEFKVGDSFIVKVKSVEMKKYEINGKEYRLPKIKASKKEAEQKPADLYFDQFEEGQCVMGEIKAMADNNGVFVCIENKMDVLCSVPRVNVPARGMRCVVEITKKDPETKRLNGIIRNMF